MKPVSSVFSYFSIIILAVFLGFFVASCEKKSQPTESRTQVEQSATSAAEQSATGATNVAEQGASADCTTDCIEGDSVVIESTQTTTIDTDTSDGDVVVTTTETITVSQENAENTEDAESTEGAEEAQPVESATDSASALPNAAVVALQQKGVVRIGVFGDKPPFGYIDKNGANAGYDVAFAKRIAQEIFGDSSKVEFVLVEAANRVEFLRSNKVDIILANFTKTPERAEQVDFTLPYMKVALGVAVLQDVELANPEQLQGKTLIVNKGTTADAFFTKNYPDVNMLKYDQNTEAFAALLDGRGDALAHDNTLLFAWVKENPRFKVAIKELGNQDVIAAAVQKGNAELRQFIDDLMVRLAEEQFFHKAYDATLKAHFTDDIKADDIVIEGGKL